MKYLYKARNGFLPEDCLNFIEKAGFDLYYCKHTDLKAMPGNTMRIIINGSSLPVAKVKGYCAGLQTDVLARYREHFDLNHQYQRQG